MDDLLEKLLGIFLLLGIAVAIIFMSVLIFAVIHDFILT